MTLLQAIILGLVEGITEYLPISSTGHLIITTTMLGLNEPVEIKQAVDAFSIVIQGGAILAVLGLYRKRVAQMLRGLLGKDRIGLRFAINIIISFLPAAILGVLVADWIEEKLFYPQPVIAALALGGVVMILLGGWQKRFFQEDKLSETGVEHRFTDIEDLSWRQALLIGLAQCLALWPGTSRSMTTIVGGMLVGLRPKQAAEYSFLLGLPTLGGACVYKGAQNLLQEGPSMIYVLGYPALIVGRMVATLSAAIAVKCLVGFLSHHGVAIFGWYRILLAMIVALLIWRGKLTITPGMVDAAVPSPTLIQDSGEIPRS